MFLWSWTLCEDVWRRHRLQLVCCLAIALLQTLLALSQSGQMAHQADKWLFLCQFLLCAIVVLSCFHAFSLTADAPLGQRDSGFPARLFRLPVPTATLTLLVMLQGTAVVAGLALFYVLVIFRPADMQFWLLSSTLVCSTLFAWMQLIFWSPYPLRFLRLPILGVTLPVIVEIPVAGFLYRSPTSIWIAALAALLILAYALAPIIVARGRSGGVEEWTWPRRILGGIFNALPTRSSEFVSPLEAQAWLEYWQRGIIFTVMIGYLGLIYTLGARFLPTGNGDDKYRLLLLALPTEVAAQVREFTVQGSLVVVMLALVPFLAGAFALDLGLLKQRGPGQKLGCSTFLAIRPLTDGQIVLAKWRMAWNATLHACLLAALAALLALVLTGNLQVVAAAPALQTSRAYLLLASGTAIWLGFTWLQLAAGAWIGLAGRESIRLMFGVVVLLVVAVGVFLVYWVVDHPEHREILQGIGTWIVYVLIACKFLIATLLARHLMHHDMVKNWLIVAIGGAWIAAACGITAFFCQVVPNELASALAIALVVTLLLPLNGLAAAPVAVAWNRHR